MDFHFFLLIQETKKNTSTYVECFDGTERLSVRSATLTRWKCEFRHNQLHTGLGYDGSVWANTFIVRAPV